MAILAAPVRKMTGARPASRGVNYTLLGLAFLALAVAKLVSVYYEMAKRMQKIAFGFEGCTRHRDIMAPEDIIPVFEGVFVSSSEERRKHVMKKIGVEATEGGGLFAIWNVDTSTEAPRTARLELEGFPEEYRFRPHGLDYRRETQELFVVNHAYSQGRERIDVFKVTEAFPQDPLPTIHPSLLEGPARRAAVASEAEAVPNVDDVTAEQGQSMDTPGGNDGMATGVEPRSSSEKEFHAEEEEVSGQAKSEMSPAVGFGPGGGDKRNSGQADTDADDSSASQDDDSGGHKVATAALQGGGEIPAVATDTERPVDIVEDGTSPEAPRRATLETSAAGAIAGEEDSVENAKYSAVEESPKDKAKRLKREAKEAAVKAKAEQRRQLAEAKKVQAEERAAAKAASARVSARAKGLSRGTTPIKLTYSFSVEHPFVMDNIGVLNDIALAGDDELYVTQFMPLAHPLHGPTQPDSVMDYVRLLASAALMMLQLSRPPIIRCTGIRGPDVSCEQLATGIGASYNGIALSPDKERLLVSDTVAMQLVVFNRSLVTGELAMQQRIDMPGSLDNLELDPYRAAKGEEAYTSGVVNAWDFLAYQGAMVGASRPSQFDSWKVAGGMSSIVFDKTTGNYTSNLEMWQDGDLLSISSAAATASGSRLLGSAMEEGFLICRPPPCLHGGAGGQDECRGWQPYPGAPDGKE